MNASLPQPPTAGTVELLQRLERRIARIEEHLGLGERTETSSASPETKATTVSAATEALAVAIGGVSNGVVAEEDEEDALEFEVGQNWFAKIGIVALATGVAFLLSQPFAGYAAAAPSLFGYGLVAVLFALAHAGRDSYELISKYFRGAVMVLLFFATLRLFYFGAAPVLGTDSAAGRALLLLVVAFNLTLALRRRSPWLVGLGIVMGCATALAIGTPWFVLGVLTLLTGIVAVVRVRLAWPALGIVGLVLVNATYVLWGIGNPLLGHDVKVVTEPAAAPFFVLAWVALFAVAADQRRDRAVENITEQFGALINCGLGYLVFLVHALLGFEGVFAAGNIAAFAVFLALAVMVWVREHSRFATFAYAMTGYTALSMAIIKASGVPDVFVWLSLQSLVVVTTAIWFRSRFIVVANILIFVAVAGAYIAMAKAETGISIGFGVVAMVSARILNWKKDRLELQTELMRNAYLVSAFLVFPYALYHLVSHVYVVPAWIGMALFYYGMNLLIRNPKYRWMGHGTLLLCAAYIVIVGMGELEGMQRILSFLALGAILLLVSLVITRNRARRHSDVRRSRESVGEANEAVLDDRATRSTRGRSDESPSSP